MKLLYGDKVEVVPYPTPYSDHCIIKYREEGGGATIPVYHSERQAWETVEKRVKEDSDPGGGQPDPVV